MSKLFFDLLDANRQKVFSDLAPFLPEGILGGGTAISLYLKHRQSIDLDVFSPKAISRDLLKKVSDAYPHPPVRPLVDTGDELSLIVQESIKLTFLFFPFSALHPPTMTHSIPVFALPDLASNKAYAIGRRGIFRDYVDLLFLIESGIALPQIIQESEKRFVGNFDRKLFLEQLVYFEDLTDFTTDYLGKAYQPVEVKAFLEEQVRTFLSKENQSHGR